MLARGLGRFADDRILTEAKGGLVGDARTSCWF